VRVDEDNASILIVGGITLGAISGLGLAPSAAREGDKICLFFGAQVPFLVRKTEDGLYQFVGECYVHGIMDGEVMRAATDNEEIGALIEDLVEDFRLI
jgi:hypothetical protein